ncbi:MAG: type II and III secretion system family protein [Alphaproteobacteria bacterium]|nr:type II and III secretion system family protein [Alphaproteobacteria bacterium]
MRVLFQLVLYAAAFGLLASCAPADVPGARNLHIPSPTMAAQRQNAVNDRPDSVIYLPLGSDVLVPKAAAGTSFPDEIVGPFELRSETLAGALQLILADYDVSLAFETEEAFSRTVTVANLRGPLGKVVERICGLADLYCSYEDGLVVVKETQTFTVTIPPIGGDNDILGDLAQGISAITGATPITESATRTIIYEATSRTADLAERYFQRVRANTALIVFEVYIWEVSLTAGNSTGIDWEKISSFGKFNTGISIPGGTGADFNPISIGLPTTGGVTFGADDVLQFISQFGAVKTISQPQITVLSGADATLRAADTVNYVSSLSRTIDNGETTVSTTTDSVDTGFTLTIASNWDNATVYGTIKIELDEFRGFQDFDADGTTLQLPQTTERELSTQIRIRPGDSLLIAGLVRESDQYDSSGPGFSKPLLSVSRAIDSSNTELVFLLKPRVIVYTMDGEKIPSNAEMVVTGKLPDPADFKEEVSDEPQPVAVFPVETKELPADPLPVTPLPAVALEDKI